MEMIYIGIDNGVSGTIGIIDTKSTLSYFYEMPVIREQSYTKTKQMITRVNYRELMMILRCPGKRVSGVLVLLERPMVNPTRFKATASALRSFEATLIAIEAHGYPYRYIDSKEWQKLLLFKGIKGTSELKKASVSIGCRLFPQHKDAILKHKDADGLMIAEFARISM